MLDQQSHDFPRDFVEGMKAAWEEISYSMEKIFDASGGGVMFYNSRREILEMQPLVFGAPKEHITKYKVPVSGQGNAVRVFSTGQGYLSNAARGDPNILQFFVEIFSVQQLMTVPIEIKGRPIGVFHIINKQIGQWTHSDLENFRYVVLGYGGLIQKIFQYSTALKDSFCAEFLERMVKGDIGNEWAFFQAFNLGLNLSREWVFILARPDDLSNLNPKSYLNEQGGVLSPQLTDNLQSLCEGCWAGFSYQGLIILVPFRKTDPHSLLMDLGLAIRERLNKIFKGAAFSLGVGPVCRRLEDYPGAFRQASRAIEVGLNLYGPGQVTLYSALGFYDLLYDLCRDPKAQPFMQSVLGRVEAYDQKHNTGLLRTLAAYIECGGDINQVARRMFVHVNTVRYRLVRIEELTGRTLANARDRFEFEFAIRMLDLSKLRLP